MKILVDKMPLCEYDCPFSKEVILEDRYERYRMKYECMVTKDLCDLTYCKCSGLKVIDLREEGER